MENTQNRPHDHNFHHPCAVVSIYQLNSLVPGLIPIANGQPGVHSYRGAMMFVDHTSDLTYIPLKHALITDETLDAKHTFECIVEQPGVCIHHYHCNNG